MQVVGVDASGVDRFAVPLPHGADPIIVAYDQGWVVERSLEAARDPGGELVLWFAVRPVDSDPRPVQRSAGRDIGLELPAGEQPVVRQRVAAYGVVLSERGLLATQYSDRTAVNGRWGMPGGGIDDGEEPAATVLREVHEETAQTVELGALVTVQTSHWVGRSPTRRVEDFHAVRLVYRATCPAPGDPVVLDVGGTTSDARWVSLAGWRAMNWTVNWRDALERLLPPP